MTGLLLILQVWTATAGTIDGTGHYTAPSIGSATVTVSYGGRTASATVLVEASSVVGGVPFGSFHVPLSEFGAPYTGALRALSTGTAANELRAARAAGVKLVVSLPGSRDNYTNADGTFSLIRWKARMDLWLPLTPLLSEYRDVILLNYLVDEPNCLPCWGGQAIPHAALQEMTRYAAERWPFLPTTIRVTPGWLKGVTTIWPFLDAAWSQYEGPLHVPCAGKTPPQCAAQSIADARALGVALVMGSNTLDGGDGSSRVNGTFAKDPNLNDAPEGRYRYQMSPAEYRRADSTFLASPDVCAVIDWRHSTSYNISDLLIRAFDTLPAVRSARTKLAQIAKSRTITPRCAKP